MIIDLIHDDVATSFRSKGFGRFSFGLAAISAALKASHIQHRLVHLITEHERQKYC
jgi:hypothetical protein